MDKIIGRVAIFYEFRSALWCRRDAIAFLQTHSRSSAVNMSLDFTGKLAFVTGKLPFFFLFFLSI